MERYYLKCTYCERPLAIECEKEELVNVSKSLCPLCTHKELPLTVMGRVEGVKNKLIVDGVKSVCDARCTNAVGPHCDCVCSKVNHGTHRLVTYSKENGTLSVVDQKLLEGNETYLAKIKELAEQKQNFRQLILAWMNNKFGATEKLYKEYRMNYSARLTNEQWNDHYKYGQYKDQMDKIEKLKTIKNKVNAYLKLFEQVRIS